MIWRSVGNYDQDEVSDLTGVYCTPEEDMAQQQYRTDVDINELVKRFGLTGDLPISRQLAEYGDFSEVTDFHTAMNQLRRGEEAFLELPVLVREKFGHDMAKFYDWLSTSDNIKEAVDLGLLPESALSSPEPHGDASPIPDTPPGDNAA
jgi:hypothetical protein